MTLGDHRLFEQTAIGILPNLASFPLLDTEPADDPGAVLLGDPSYAGLTRYHDLPQAGPELADVAALYGPRLWTAPRIREAATEAAFWDLVRRADAAERRPARRLPRGTQRQRAARVWAPVDQVKGRRSRSRHPPGHHPRGDPQRLQHRLAAPGHPRPGTAGDDALGLTASFLEAGARFVLVSVPPADDEATRTFTVTWHRHRRAHTHHWMPSAPPSKKCSTPHQTPCGHGRE